MSASRLLTILITALPLSACSGDRPTTVNTPTAPTPPIVGPPPAVPTPSGRVQGIVLDFQSARPIAGAVVGFATGFGADSVPTGMTETSVSDANGRYSLSQPPANPEGAPYHFVVNNQGVGTGYPRAANYRADLAVDRGLCVSRYGMVLDSSTYLPISGATVGSQTTGADGWYQIDWGCGVGQIGFNTALLRVSHPNYMTLDRILGRGIEGTYRLDVLLTPR